MRDFHHVAAHPVHPLTHPRSAAFLIAMALPHLPCPRDRFGGAAGMRAQTTTTTR
jgi:hypothetical protein